MRATVSTHKTVLVPGEFFRRESAAGYLALAGLGCDSGQTAVYSDPQRPQVAVMAVDRECHRRLSDRLGDRLFYTSPLLFEPGFSSGGLWMTHVDGVLYVKFYDRVLRLAEALRAEGTPDILYYLGRLNTLFPLRDYPLALSGSKTLARQLKTYFRDVRCE